MDECPQDVQDCCYAAIRDMMEGEMYSLLKKTKRGESQALYNVGSLSYTPSAIATSSLTISTRAPELKSSAYSLLEGKVDGCRNSLKAT